MDGWMDGWLWRFTFCSGPEHAFYIFIICLKVTDSLWWGGVLGGGVYGGKMDFCWLYGPEITDMMDIWVEKGTTIYIL